MKKFVDRIPELERIRYVGRNEISVEQAFSLNDSRVVVIRSRTKQAKIKRRASSKPYPFKTTTSRLKFMESWSKPWLRTFRSEHFCLERRMIVKNRSKSGVVGVDEISKIRRRMSYQTRYKNITNESGYVNRLKRAKSTGR